MRTICFLALVAFLFVAPTSASAEKRVALVIGIGAYDHSAKLANPANDASDIAAALGPLGFKVTIGLDTDQKSLRQKVREFARDVKSADVALFFYAGHGLQVSGKNYLMPTDAQLSSELDLDLGEVFDLETVLRTMTRDAKTTLVFLDACRDNPIAQAFGRSLSRSSAVGNGLAPVELRTSQAGHGIYIAYATDPGEVAGDGTGRNSPFTTALLQRIGAPGKSIHDIMLDVRKDVLAATGSQRPRGDDGLVEPFYFRPRVDVPGGAQSTASLSVVDRAPELECDRLAAHPDDPDAVVHGARLERSNAPRAVEACAQARAQFPAEKRFAYQLSRAYGFAGENARQQQMLGELARDGYPAASFSLGIIYERGEQVPADKAVSVGWYRRAAEGGHARAMAEFGQALLYGKGIDKDETAAVTWLRKAEAASQPSAKVLLGQLYSDGKGVLPKDERRAFALFREAVEIEPGYGCYLAQMYKNGTAVSKDPAQAVVWFEKAANGGCKTSMLNLGEMYGSGTGVAKDEAKAIEWLLRAANAGDAEGMIALAEMYRGGRGGPRNDKEAFAWVRRSAEADYPPGMRYLGYYYMNAIGVEKDPAAAAQWFLKGAERDDSVAMRMLGFLHLEKGDAGEVQAGIDWMRKAAEKGDTHAMTQLGDFYRQGKYVRKDGAEAVRWYKLAMDSGVKDAIPPLGRMYLAGEGIEKNEAEGIRLLRQGVEAKVPSAMVALGEAYQQGWGVPKTDARAFELFREAVEIDARYGCWIAQMYKAGAAVSKDLAEAAKWFKRAADEFNCTTSMINLARMHRDGTGVEKSQAKAFEWTRKAAEAGVVEAMVEVARMYRAGQGGAKDDKQAFAWALKSAEAGSADGMQLLGDFYLRGIGVAKDPATAAKWHQRSANKKKGV